MWPPLALHCEAKTNKRCDLLHQHPATTHTKKKSILATRLHTRMLYKTLNQNKSICMKSSQVQRAQLAHRFLTILGEHSICFTNPKP